MLFRSGRKYAINTNQNFSHGELLSLFVSSTTGFPCPEERLIVSDEIHSLLFKFNHSCGFSLPMFTHQNIEPVSFFRLSFSLREYDDTSKHSDYLLPLLLNISPQ